MAELLYRLGKWSARRGKTVLAIWLGLLIVLGATVGLVGVKFTDALSVGDTPTTQVSERLEDVFAQSGREGGTDSVQMVATTADGKDFTQAQQDAIKANIASAKDIENVADVVDPFATEAERADGAKQLTDGQKQLDAAQAKIDASRTTLADGQSKLDAGQKQLDTALAQAKAGGAPAAALEQFKTQQAKLDASKKQLDAGKAELESGEKKLNEQQVKLTQGSALLKLSDGIRMVSEDGSTAIITVTFTTSSGTPPAAAQAAIDTLFAEHPVDGVSFLLSGGTTADASQLIGFGEIAGLIIAALALLVMLGTFIAAGLPILTALIGVGTGMTLTVLLAAVVEVSNVTPMLGLMLGLAVGIDYSLFIVNRHRRQLKEGMQVNESVGLATGTSGNAVVFAGLTVIIALLALNVTGLPFLGLMGTVGALCVLVAVLVAITLTPALLGLAGTRVLRSKERAAAKKAHDAATAANAAGSAAEHATQAPIKVLARWKAALAVLAGVAALLVIAIPALDMRTNLPDNGTQPRDTAAYQAYTLLGEKFGEGQNSPLVVLADLPAGLSEDEATAAQLKIGTALKNTDDVAAVAPAALSEDRRAAVFQILPKEGPAAESTTALVHHLRDASPLAGEYPIGVAGMAAANIDMSEKIGSTLPAYLGLVIGLSFLILILVFRSLLVPLIATLGFVLSYFAALGGVVAIYQWGWLGPVFGVETPGPILSFLPTILVGVLFGLAMDYMLFLGSGMREAYAHGTEARAAVVQGVRAGRSVVIAAAIIMIAVFGGFVFSHMSMVRPIGFALAFGVLVDAFVVRLVIIPALMTLLGRSAWWLPRWLDKILPNVDVEGSGLERRHGAIAAEATVDDDDADAPAGSAGPAAAVN